MFFFLFFIFLFAFFLKKLSSSLLDFLIFFNFFPELFCWFYFFNIELVENLALYFFSLKHCGLLQYSIVWFFFLLWFFLKLSLSIVLFLTLRCLRITTLDFLIKHYRLLQCFPAKFFFLLFFCYDFFQNYLC
jgi:hypothetical protein